MAKRHHGMVEHYAGKDHRRAMEEHDGAMMASGHGSHANMPQEVIMKNYPSEHSYLPENLNDSLSGIDHQKGLDSGKMHKHLAPKKV